MELFKNKIIWSFGTKASAFVFFFLLNLYLARTLWVESFWLWSFFLSILTIYWTISHFWINGSVQKYVAQHNHTTDLLPIIKQWFILRCIVSMIASIVFILVFPILMYQLDKEVLIPLTILWAILICITTLGEYIKSLFIWLHNIKALFYITSLEHISRLILVVLGLTLFWWLYSIMMGYIWAFILSIKLWVYILWRIYSWAVSTTANDTRYYKQILSYSYPLLFISLWFIVFTEIDTFMLWAMRSESEVGIYAVAKQLIIILPNISIALSMSIMPLFAKLNTNNKEYLTGLFKKVLLYNNLIFTIIIIILLISADILIEFMYGEAYHEAANILRILCIYLYLMVNSVFYSSLLNYLWKAYKRAVFVAIGITLNIWLNLYLIPLYGATGAAIGTCVSFFPYFVLNIIEARKLLRSI